jgi:uncharacterized protein (DUF427 family)
MATRMREAMGRALEELRYEPTEKRVRALLAGEEVVDSTQALLVWGPKQDAVAVAGLVAFYDERVDVVLDGERRPRPRTAVSKAILDEAGITGE